MEYGLLTINWAKRDLQIEGLTGESSNAMTYTELKEALAAHEANPEPGVEVEGVVVWNPDEAGGRAQLCFYDLDLLRSAAGPYEDDDPDDDQGEEL
jgi:hypothetical protein